MKKMIFYKRSGEKEEEQELINQKVCPKCSGELVERVSKRGPFIGCSNYPKCRFIKNI